MVTKHIFSQNVNQQGSRNLIIHLSVSHLHFQLELHAKTFSPQNVAAVAYSSFLLITADAGDEVRGPVLSKNETLLFSHYPHHALPAVLNVHFFSEK